jgi:hypothetical protein
MRKGGVMPGERKVYATTQIGVRMHPELKSWLEQRAEAEHMAPSVLVRTWIEREARRDLQVQAPTEVAPDAA